MSKMGLGVVALFILLVSFAAPTVAGEVVQTPSFVAAERVGDDSLL